MEHVLFSTEVELYVETMKPQKMEDLGSKQWMEWHQRLQKLNQQAVIETSAMKEESVKETLVSYGKIPVLVHESILINIWKHKVLPLLLRMEPEPENTFIAYSVLYHEAVCVALLELVMFHGGASESLEDTAADLLDYACGTVSQLLILDNELQEAEEHGKCDITRQQDNLAFDIGIRSLTVLRYMADYLDRLPLGVTARMFTVHDIPVLLVQILLERPWVRNNKQYSGGRWMAWDGEAIGPAEAQVWLALRQLLLDPACLTHYEMTDSRRSQLMKLQPLISPTLLDQISPLIELQKWLCMIATSSQPPAAHKPLLLETILELKQNIYNQCNGKWKKIARHQLPVIFCKDHENLVEMAQRLNDAFNTDLLEKLEIKESSVVCAKCGKNAIQRCSRCKIQWYCSRNCQVSHWSEHKDKCVTVN